MKPWMALAARILLAVTWFKATIVASSAPHVVFIIADDMGWMDVGYHGSEIKTPNIDALATSASTVRLENFYVHPSCSPTRSALMSGRYASNIGLSIAIQDTHYYCLPFDNPILSEKMRSMGYATELLGKWHLGNSQPKCLPQNRGFDNFTGLYAGGSSYYRGWTVPLGVGSDRYDMHANCVAGSEDCVWWQQDVDGVYKDPKGIAPHLLNKYPGLGGEHQTKWMERLAVDKIHNRDETKPLFLELAFYAPHDPLEPHPDDMADSDCLSVVPNKRRQLYCGLVYGLDKAIGKVTAALEARNMLNDTFIWFSSDNGGVVNGGAVNYPLRGTKGTAWEAAVHVPSFIYYPRAVVANAVHTGLVHVCDIYPTVVGVVMGHGNGTETWMDGVDQSAVLFDGKPVVRTAMVAHYTLEPAKTLAYYKVQDGKTYKFMMGSLGWDRIYKEPKEFDSFYEIATGLPGTTNDGEGFIDRVATQMMRFTYDAGQPAATTALMWIMSTFWLYKLQGRHNARMGFFERTAGDGKNFRIFDLTADPYESNDIYPSWSGAADLKAEALAGAGTPLDLPSLWWDRIDGDFHVPKACKIGDKFFTCPWIEDTVDTSGEAGYDRDFTLNIAEKIGNIGLIFAAAASAILLLSTALCCGLRKTAAKLGPRHAFGGFSGLSAAVAAAKHRRRPNGRVVALLVLGELAPLALLVPVTAGSAGPWFVAAVALPYAAVGTFRGLRRAEQEPPEAPLPPLGWLAAERLAVLGVVVTGWYWGMAFLLLVYFHHPVRADMRGHGPALLAAVMAVVAASWIAVFRAPLRALAARWRGRGGDNSSVKKGPPGAGAAAEASGTQMTSVTRLPGASGGSDP